MPDRSTNIYIFLTFSIYYSPRFWLFARFRARSLSKNRKDLHDGCQVNDTEEAEQGSEAAIEICFHSPYQRQDLYRPVPGRGPQGDAQAHGEEAHGEEGHGEEGRGPQGDAQAHGEEARREEDRLFARRFLMRATRRQCELFAFS